MARETLHNAKLAPMSWCSQLLLSACIVVGCSLPRHKDDADAFSQKNGTGRFSSGGSKTGIQVQVVVMLAFPDPTSNTSRAPAITDGPSILPAIQLAVDHINKRGDILVNHSVSIVVRDDGCNIVTTAALSYLDILTRYRDGRSFLAGMVGPSCSDSAIFVSSLNAQAETALVNLHIASSPVLKNETRFPYAFGTAGSSDGYVEALKSMIRNRWQSVAVIFEEDAVFYRHIATRLTGDLDEQFSIPVHSITITSDSINKCLTTLDQTSPKPCVVFLLSNNYLSNRLLCFAFSKGYQSYKWLFVETMLTDLSTSVNFSYGHTEYACSQEDMQNILNEGLFMFVRLVPSQPQNETTVSGYTYAEYWAQYAESVQKANGSYQTTLWGNVLYDAMWALALSLNNSIDNLLYVDERQVVAMNTKDKLKAVDFNGVSGRIKFSNNTVIRIINISQALNNTEMLIGEYDPASSTLHMYREERLPSCFDADHLLAIGILLYMAAFVALIMTLISHALTLIYWKQKHIKASDPRLSQYIFGGCYLICLGANVLITWNTYPAYIEQFEGFCHIFTYSVFLGFCLVFSTICAKTWRFYRIFTHFENPGPFVSNCALNVFIITSTSLMAVLLIVWTVVYPYSIVQQPSGALVCQTIAVSYDYWAIALLSYSCLPLLSAIILSLATNKLTSSQKKLFKINSPVLFGYMFSIVLCCFSVGIFAINDVNRYILATLLCCTLVVFSLVFVMLPPLLSMCRERHIRLAAVKPPLCPYY